MSEPKKRTPVCVTCPRWINCCALMRRANCAVRWDSKANQHCAHPSLPKFARRSATISRISRPTVTLAEPLLAEAVRRMEASARSVKAKRVSEGNQCDRRIASHKSRPRATVSKRHARPIDEAARYCSVEYDVESGTRGGRGARVESLLERSDRR